MLTLNYASEELKNEVKLKRIYNITRKVNFIFIFVALILSIAFLTTRIILQNSFNKIVEETTLITKNSQGYNEKVKKINQKVNMISDVQKTFAKSTAALKLIAEQTPENITYYSVKYEPWGRKTYLTGYASSRDNLVKFKQKLESSNVFSDIKFPIKNITEKNNINFNIELTIKNPPTN